MAKKEFTLHGKSLEELKKLNLEELAKLLPSRQKRKIKRGLTEQEKNLWEKVKKSSGEKLIRTHVRTMLVFPDFVGKKLAIHDGKDWNVVEITPEMIGHYLGEFSLTRERVTHSGP